MNTDDYLSIEAARRNRLSKKTRQRYASGVNQVVIWADLVGRSDLLMWDPEEEGKRTLDLSKFDYQTFLDFLEWTINNKTVGVSTLDSYRSAVKNLYKTNRVPLPDEYHDDMKEVYSGKIFGPGILLSILNFAGI